MRRLLPLALALLAGCGSSVGPTQRRPGGDVVLPKYISPAAVVLQQLACSAQKKDSAQKAKSGSRTNVADECRTLPVTAAKPPK